MKAFSRTHRLSDQIQRELALLIQREVKDPRLGMVTVTHVAVTKDLSSAKVFFTLMGDNDSDRVLQNRHVLQDAAGYLRSQLSKSIKARTVPQLHFVYDESITRGAEISALLSRTSAKTPHKQDPLDNPET